MDRNVVVWAVFLGYNESLSARRAWIEISLFCGRFGLCRSRSPQGERG